MVFSSSLSIAQVAQVARYLLRPLGPMPLGRTVEDVERDAENSHVFSSGR